MEEPFLHEKINVHDRSIPKITKRIKNWKTLARWLGVGEPGISAIDNEGNDEDEKRNKLLYKWIEREGNAATYYTLIEAFENNEDKDTADYIRDLLGSCVCISIYIMPHYSSKCLLLNSPNQSRNYLCIALQK